MLAQNFLVRSAATESDRVAVVEPAGASIRYSELDRLSDEVCELLLARGIEKGDRVSFYLRKSIDSVAVIFGILKAGGAYVPLDPGAPPARNAFILQDCSVRHLFIERRFVESLQNEIPPFSALKGTTVLEEAGSGEPLRLALQREARTQKSPRPVGSAEDLAYILYTSGSTGKPKGVCISHRAAVSFVDWCTELLQPTAQDRFSSHAPFHFDLSILDLYVPLKHGASVFLIGEEQSKDPQMLASLIADAKLTVWYSTPSVLSLLLQFGKLGDRDLSSLRAVLFAGEIFPIKHLKALQKSLKDARLINLYGPTETNVCTYYEVESKIPVERTDPVPIGKACSHFRTKVVNPSGETVQTGEEGELCASGAGVMEGYWNRPDRTSQAFETDGEGIRWYRTGDLVREQPDGNYLFLGRRDRMVKKRGYRIELGEIEAGLYRHPQVMEAAVVACQNENQELQLKAFLTLRGSQRVSLIELKSFCMQNLPAYMVPDHFRFSDSLPKTSTDKIDYQKLLNLA